MEPRRLCTASTAERELRPCRVPHIVLRPTCQVRIGRCRLERLGMAVDHGKVRHSVVDGGYAAVRTFGISLRIHPARVARAVGNFAVSPAPVVRHAVDDSKWSEPHLVLGLKFLT